MIPQSSTCPSGVCLCHLWLGDLLTLIYSTNWTNFASSCLCLLIFVGWRIVSISKSKLECKEVVSLSEWLIVLSDTTASTNVDINQQISLKLTLTMIQRPKHSSTTTQATPRRLYRIRSKMIQHLRSSPTKLWFDRHPNPLSPNRRQRRALAKVANTFTASVWPMNYREAMSTLRDP